MPALYTVASELRALLDQADPETGELPVDLGERLGQLSLSMDEKIDGLCGLLKEIQADSAAALAESKRLVELAASRANSANRLKEYVKDCLATAGLKDHRTALFYVWLQKSPPACEFTGLDPEMLPPHLKRVTVEPSKSAALEEWKKTGTVPEGFEVKQSLHLRLR